MLSTKLGARNVIGSTLAKLRGNFVKDSLITEVMSEEKKIMQLGIISIQSGMA